ncbi:MAG: biotin-dependent carboxyltransferase family protein [Planctomycetes bacterium]|nr:biotin-dependent carboxyltransferase family protein [Planctomycetota bacterium]
MKYPYEIIANGAFTLPTTKPLDIWAARCANSFVGNAQSCSTIEVCVLGPTIKILGEYVIAICGADLSPQLNGTDILNNNAHAVKRGDILSFGETRSGMRAYIALGDGFSDGNAYALPTSNVLPVSAAPEFELLDVHLRAALFSYKFTISKLANRMGAQLEQRLDNNFSPIITSPVLPGTVQLTPDGRLIILLADCQLTGGYPRLLQLRREALNIMAQLTPGAALQFRR